MANAGGGGGDHVHEAVVVEFACGVFFAGFPNDGARASEASFPVAVEHGATGEDDGWDVDGAGGHDAGGSGFVAAGGEDDAVEGVTVEDFYEAEVGEVSV